MKIVVVHQRVKNELGRCLDDAFSKHVIALAFRLDLYAENLDAVCGSTNEEQNEGPDFPSINHFFIDEPKAIQASIEALSVDA
jgi:hypothetical protein